MTSERANHTQPPIVNQCALAAQPLEIVERTTDDQTPFTSKGANLSQAARIKQRAAVAQIALSNERAVEDKDICPY